MQPMEHITAVLPIAWVCSAEIVLLRAAPQVVEGFDELGLAPTPSAPEQFDAVIRSELEKNLAVARQADLRAERARA